MASDQLFKKRQAATNRDLRRTTANRKAAERVLIVCEGAETEPNYLEDLRQDLGLTTADVRVCGKECGSAPRSIVEYAKKVRKNDPGFDRVYCVFDKNGHPTYSQALQMINDIRVSKGKMFRAMRSVPCFEFWLLLHYERTTCSFAPTGSKSICETVISRLREYLPDYAKGARGTYRLTKSNIDQAIAHADFAYRQCVSTGAEGPLTEMHLLVQDLRGLVRRG